MLYQLNDPNIKGEMGKQMGTGISSGLQTLMQMKVQDIKRQKEKAGLEAMGLPGALAGLDPRIIQQAAQNQQKAKQQELVQAYLQRQRQQPSQDRVAPQQVAGQPGGEKPGETEAIMAMPTDVRKDLLKEREYNRRDIRQTEDRAFRETKEYRKDLSEGAKTSKDDLLAIKGQLDQVRSGKMMGRGAVLAVDLIGNFVGLNEAQKTAMKDDASVIFEKYGIRYLRSLKDIFGARPTQWDAEQFQKGFPSLYQSKEGQEAILGDMRTAAKLKIQKNNIKNSIVAENNNVPPMNLEALVDKRMAPLQRNAWRKSSQKMKSILNKNAPDPKSAVLYGKGRELENKDGLVYVSDGHRWKVKFEEEF
jgi:hypothetical protein